MNLNQNLQSTIGKSNLATTGASTDPSIFLQGIIDQNQQQVAQLNADKMDLALGLREKMNALISGYQTATGERLGGQSTQMYGELDDVVGVM